MKKQAEWIRDATGERKLALDLITLAVWPEGKPSSVRWHFRVGGNSGVMLRYSLKGYATEREAKAHCIKAAARLLLQTTEALVREGARQTDE